MLCNVNYAVMAQVIMYGSYTMWLMMPYLTEVWDMSIIQAAAVINIFDGVVAMMADYLLLLWCGISITLVSFSTSLTTYFNFHYRIIKMIIRVSSLQRFWV